MKSEKYWYTVIVVFVACAIVLTPARADAYIGPGAGFTLVSSFLVVLLSFLSSLLAFLTWPIRWAMQVFRSRKAIAKSRVRRVIVVGLDGQDPELTDKFMAEGLLPNFSSLREQGGYARLQTSLPAESPVAWSSFQTGCNPGRHRVFDFLVPNRKTYLPELCSASVSSPSRKLSIGKYEIPLGKPRIAFGRKSQSFWKILSDHGVFSTILRVPITFPPEKFNGLLLSAMSVPDLRGSQGTFSHYTSDRTDEEKYTGGIQIPVDVKDGVVKSYISGPINSLRKDKLEMRIDFEARILEDRSEVELKIDKKSYRLKRREYSPWIPLAFKAGLGFKTQGICRFYLLETTPHFKLYMTPINIAPGRPSLPISHPFSYAMYLARTLGDFSTLGMAEDTWALNERVLDEDAFLKQTYLIHQERESMFFDAVKKTNRGLVACVFDITDRLQHMFWRYLEADHPANRDKDVEVHRDEIKKLYQKMDGLVGRVMESLDDDTLLIVMSDHGFKSFKRGVNLNTWLLQNGFLAVKDKPTGADAFGDVDWEKTKAYAVGLGGIYLNLAGREAKGIVKPGKEAQAIKQEIIAGLRELFDAEYETRAVREVYDTREVYDGPYTSEAPDLFVGFKIGYRADWKCATGAVTENVFEDNTKSWSGDHCLNPPDVPGILFCNREFDAQNPSIMDIGPTILDLFGVSVPSYCDGKPLMPERKQPGMEKIDVDSQNGYPVDEEQALEKKSSELTL